MKGQVLDERQLSELKAKLNEINYFPDCTLFLLPLDKNEGLIAEKNETLYKISIELDKLKLIQRIEEISKSLEAANSLAILDKLLEQEIKTSAVYRQQDEAVQSRDEQIFKYDTFAQLPDNTGYEDFFIPLSDNSPLAILLRLFDFKTKVETTDKKRLLIYIGYGDVKINGFLDEKTNFVVPGSNGFKQSDVLRAIRNFVLDLSNLKFNKALKGVPLNKIAEAKDAVFSSLDFSPEARSRMYREYELLDEKQRKFIFVDLPDGVNPFDADYFILNNGRLDPLFNLKKDELINIKAEGNKQIVYVRYIEPHKQVINKNNPNAKCNVDQVDKYIRHRLRDQGNLDDADAVQDYKDDLQLGLITDEPELFYLEEEARFLFAPRKACFLYDEAGKIEGAKEFATTYISGYFKIYSK